MTGLIILAAGGSLRLGQPKQNLLFQNKTLLQRAIETGLNSKCQPIIVVLGANADMIRPISGTIILYNKDWKKGITSSIRIAVEEISKDSSIDNVIIMLCDQPFVNAELLNALINKQIETCKPIVACTYNGTTGVPVLFGRTLFAGLVLLRGQEGAKKILEIYGDEIATIPFDEGSIDIDTPDDYEKLLKLSNKSDFPYSLPNEK